MRCKDCQQLMLLIDLLEVNEHKQMLQHKDKCPACESVWHEIIQMNTMLEQVAQNKIQPSKPELLIDKIMTAVIRQRKPDMVGNWLEKLFFNSFSRFTLTGISACLAIIFVVEVSSGTLAEKPRGPVAGLQIILSSQSFRKNFGNQKEEKKTLLSRCINTNNKIDINCLKTKLKF